MEVYGYYHYREGRKMNEHLESFFKNRSIKVTHDGEQSFIHTTERKLGSAIVKLSLQVDVMLRSHNDTITVFVDNQGYRFAQR